ncbi:MAG: DUF929 family protein [Terracoccus sp.]
MAKSTRTAAKQRAREQREAQARKERQRTQLVAAGVGVVVIVIAVSIGIVIANRPVPAPVGGSGAAALTKLMAIPATTLDKATVPTAQQIPVKLAGAAARKTDGKPVVLYVGAEFCPYCAVERWALIGALSRFGTFSGLSETTSSSTDALPDTPTFSFVKSSFTSDHVVFKAVETQDRENKPLQKLEGDDAALVQKYNPKGTIPWINYGGTHATNGPTVDSNAFEGKTYDQIMAAILDPTSPIGKSVGPAINVMTAQICQQNGGQPSAVCTAPGVKAASAVLAK